MGRRGAAPAAEEGTADLVSVGQMLSKPKFDRDAALEGLERAAACLRRAAQGDARVQKASVGLERALISKHVLEHCDKGVRTRAALCVALTLKLHAPDCPYTDAELETAFDLVASTFSALEDASRPLYGESLAVLHLLDTLKMPLLLLDLETPDAAVSLARTLLDSITDASGAEVLERAGRVLAALADEGADFAGLPALLETLLVHLVPPRRTESPQAAEVVRDVLARCEATLGPPTAALLTGVVARAPSARGVAPELRSHVTELLLELHATSQPILLPIVAALKPELTSEAEDARRGAVALVGRLLASGGGEMAAAYPDLLEAWARRGVDRSAAVRLAVLEQGRAALCGEQAALGEAGRAGKGASGSACAELRAAAWRVARDRVLDGDEGVRALAVRTVCDAAAGGAQGGEADDALRAVAERLRDVRPGVQGEAARGLLRVYRARGCAAVAWVPGAVAASAVRVAEVRAALEAEPLFPAAVPAEAVARRWVEVWQASGAVERSALARLLRVRTRVCGDMARLLEARRAVREAAGSGRGTKAATLAAGADAGDVARRRAAEAEVAALAQRVAAGLPVGEAAALVRVLSTHLDRKLFMALGRFCDPDLTAAAARDATTETIQRWSAAGRSDAAARAALTGLCRRMSPVLLAAPHVEALVALAAQEDGEATCGALVEVASALPDAVAARRALLVPLLAESAGRPRSAALATAACQALANAMRGRTATARRADAEQQADGDDEGGSDRSAPDTDDPGRRDGDICDLLGALCGGSDARVVKHACRALASFAAAEAHRGPDQPPLSGRAEETLGEVLRDAAAHVSCCRDPAHDARVPASYAAIGAVARLRPDLYEDVAQEVGDAVLGGGLWRHADRRQRAPGSAEDAAGPSRPASALAAGLKALTRAVAADVAPPKDAPCVAARGQLAPLVDLLLTIGDAQADPAPDALAALAAPDAAYVRLKAFGCLLHALRRLGAAAPPAAYVGAALTLQDPDPAVRAAAAAKTRRALSAALQLAAQRPDNGTILAGGKWAAMLALCNVDPVAANREAAAGAFAQYVAARRRAAAQELQRGGAGGGSMAAQPELCLTYAVFLLAHHPDFPTVGEVRDTSGAALAPFQQMLAPLLGALLGTAEDSCEAGASLPLVRKLLRVIKHSEVTAPGLRGEEPRTQEVRELADVALQMAAAAEEVILGPRGATATSARAAPYPGDVQLPRWVLRAVAVEGGSFADGSHIPRGLAAPDMRPHLGLAKKGGARRGEGAAKRGRQGAEVGSPPRARSKQAKVRSPDAASKRRRFGAEAVGCRVEVWWPEDEGWFAGTVESFDEASGRHRVAYDDGDVEHLFLPQERIRWEGGDSPGKEGPDAGSPLPPTPARATRALRSVAGNTPGGAPPSEKRRTVRGRQGRTPRAQENATAE